MTIEWFWPATHIECHPSWGNDTYCLLSETHIPRKCPKKGSILGAPSSPLLLRGTSAELEGLCSRCISAGPAAPSHRFAKFTEVFSGRHILHPICITQTHPQKRRGEEKGNPTAPVPRPGPPRSRGPSGKPGGEPAGPQGAPPERSPQVVEIGRVDLRQALLEHGGLVAELRDSVEPEGRVERGGRPSGRGRGGGQAVPRQ